MAGTDGLGQAAVASAFAEEVRSHGCQHMDRWRWRLDRLQQQVGKCLCFVAEQRQILVCLVGLVTEQLLELVDEDQDARRRVRHDAADHPGQPIGGPPQRRPEAAGEHGAIQTAQSLALLRLGEIRQGIGEFGDRRPHRPQRENVPWPPLGHAVRQQSRQQPRLYQRGFAAAGAADHGDEAALAEQRTAQFPDLLGATEEQWVLATPERPKTGKGAVPVGRGRPAGHPVIPNRRTSGIRRAPSSPGRRSIRVSPGPAGSSSRFSSVSGPMTASAIPSNGRLRTAFNCRSR